jgi:hypothetical protein
MIVAKTRLSRRGVTGFEGEIENPDRHLHRHARNAKALAEAVAYLQANRTRPRGKGPPS